MALSRPIFEFTPEELGPDFEQFNRLPQELQEITLAKLVESHEMTFTDLSWIREHELAVFVARCAPAPLLRVNFPNTTAACPSELLHPLRTCPSEMLHPLGA